jgi:hypothetical protein
MSLLARVQYAVMSGPCRPSGTKLQHHPTLARALHKSGRRLHVEMSFAIVKGDQGGWPASAGAGAATRPRAATSAFDSISPCLLDPMQLNTVGR